MKDLKSKQSSDFNLIHAISEFYVEANQKMKTKREGYKEKYLGIEKCCERGKAITFVFHRLKFHQHPGIPKETEQ